MILAQWGVPHGCGEVAGVFAKSGTVGIMMVAKPVKDSIENFTEVISMSIGNRININELADISDVVIDPALDKEKRIESFVQQIKNPLCYRCGNYVVKISFSDNEERTIEDCFEDYLKSL